MFIQVTRISDDPPGFHVSLNNPTDQTITTTLRAAMPMPGLEFQEERVAVGPGEYVLVE